jgi:hypothetical protein
MVAWAEGRVTISIQAGLTEMAWSGALWKDTMSPFCEYKHKQDIKKQRGSSGDTVVVE